jgi:hypothetical protein
MIFLRTKLIAFRSIFMSLFQIYYNLIAKTFLLYAALKKKDFFALLYICIFFHYVLVICKIQFFLKIIYNKKAKTKNKNTLYQQYNYYLAFLKKKTNNVGWCRGYLSLFN